MEYSQVGDLLCEFSYADLARLTGDSTGTLVDEDRIAYARKMAEVIINSYLVGRYNLNFTGIIDNLLKKLSVDLTVANLFEYANCKTMIPDTIIQRRSNALQLLKALQTGEAHLISFTPGVNAPPPIISNKTGNDKEISDELLDTYLNF